MAIDCSRRRRDSAASSLRQSKLGAVVGAWMSLSLACLGSGVAAAECKLSQVAELPVQLRHNKLVVDGEINGQKVGVVLDTGLTVTLIMRSAAEKLGLRRDRVWGLRMFGIGGELNLESAVVDEFKIGGATRGRTRMIIGGEHDVGDDASVLLGEDFLRDVDVEFDLAHAAVRLFEVKGCDGVSLAYWNPESASEVDIDTGEGLRSQIRLTVQINGRPMRALLDSGASISIIDSSDAIRLGVTPDTAGVVPVGRSTGLGTRPVDFWAGPFRSFAIGSETVKDPMIIFGAVFRDATYVAPGSHIRQRVAGTAAMLLGADFLLTHRVLVSHSQRKLYFTYAGGALFPQLVPAASATATGGNAGANIVPGAK